MKKYLLPHGTNAYKANLHAHTNISDGALTSEQVKDLYKSNGYSVVAYTDHDLLIPHDELTDKDFLALPGFEAQFNESNMYPGKANESRSSVNRTFLMTTSSSILLFLHISGQDTARTSSSPHNGRLRRTSWSDYS